MRAVLRFPSDRLDPRVWFIIPELEGWYPMLREVTAAVQSIELLPGGRFRATLFERPIRLAGFWLGPGRDTRRLARYEVAGTYEVQP
jgi:hypothetical protein